MDQPASTSTVLLKIYELGAHEIQSHETTVVFQLIVLLLTTVGVSVAYLFKSDERESALAARIPGKPYTALALLLLTFLWIIVFVNAERHIVDHGWKNRLIEQHLLGGVANKLGMESQTFTPVESVSPFTRLACWLLAPSLYESRYCHDGIDGTLKVLLLVELILVGPLAYLVIPAWRKLPRGRTKRLAASIVVVIISFALHVGLTRY